MKLFFILLACSLLGSSLFPGTSSVRPNSGTTFYAQQYGAEPDGTNFDSRRDSGTTYGTNFDSRRDSGTTLYAQQYGAKADGTNFDRIRDSGTKFNAQQYGAKADGTSFDSTADFGSPFKVQQNDVKADGTNFDSIADFGTTFNVQQNGVKAGDNTDHTQNLLGAWKSACASTRPSTITIPQGSFQIAAVQLEGPCQNTDLTLQLNGNFVAPSSATGQYWLRFMNVDGLTITGSGTLDGQGASWWSSCNGQPEQCVQGPSNLQILSSANVVVRGITSLNSKQFHFFLGSSNNILVEGVTIQAPGDSPNTDGIHVSSTNVHIRNVHIGTGDDCIGVLEGTSNLIVEQVTCGPGHGISIGSLGRYTQFKGVSNVNVNGVTFTGTQNGVRIKTLQGGGTSSATGVVFENIQMNNVLNPIIIDQHYTPKTFVWNPTKKFGSSLDVQLNNIAYRHITGTSASNVAINFQCSDSAPCEGIELQDVDLTLGNKQVQTSCKNVKGITLQSVKPPVTC